MSDEFPGPEAPPPVQRPPADFDIYSAFPPSPPAAPTSPARPGRSRAVGFAVLALVLLVAGAVVIRTRASIPPGFPKDWDPRVTQLVSFTELNRGLQFKHPVFVDFLTPDEYSKKTRQNPAGLTDQDKKDLEAAQGELRAFGLISGNVDLLGAVNDLKDSGTLAFYNSETKRVTVRGTQLTTDLKVTLVHELTHALQDQNFDIDKTRAGLKTSGQQEAYRALVEGDASRIEDAYVAQLSQSESTEYHNAKTAGTSKARSDLSKVPAALVAFQQSPYVFGPGLLKLIENSGGNSAVDEAFRNPPATEAQLLDPGAYFDHRSALDVALPALPAGAVASSNKKKNASSDFGALSLYIVLAQRIDPLRALDVVGGWGGDAYVDYTKDGKSCARVSFVGRDGAATQAIQIAVQDWVAAGPGGAASASDVGGSVQLDACDPGAAGSVDSSQRALQALSVAAVRSELTVSFVIEGKMPLAKAFESGTCFVHQFSFDQLNALNESATLSPADEQALQAAARSCISRAGG